MYFKYTIGKFAVGFTPVAKVFSRHNALRTLNWFLIGIKEPLFPNEIGSIDNFRTYKGDD